MGIRLTIILNTWLNYQIHLKAQKYIRSNNQSESRSWQILLWNEQHKITVPKHKPHSRHKRHTLPITALPEDTPGEQGCHDTQPLTTCTPVLKSAILVASWSHKILQRDAFIHRGTYCTGFKIFLFCSLCSKILFKRRKMQKNTLYFHSSQQADSG